MNSTIRCPKSISHLGLTENNQHQAMYKPEAVTSYYFLCSDRKKKRFIKSYFSYHCIFKTFETFISEILIQIKVIFLDSCIQWLLRLFNDLQEPMLNKKYLCSLPEK